jgi:hypothetical protein
MIAAIQAQESSAPDFKIQPEFFYNPLCFNFPPGNV